MLNALKGYLYLAVGLVILVILGAVCYGLYKVHANYEVAKETRVSTAAEKVVVDISQKQDKEIARIDQAGEDSTAKLQEILKDAHDENTERSEQASPAVNAVPATPAVASPKATGKVVQSPAKSAAPAPAVQTPVAGHSATTTRTIDELWNNYCTTFPAESSCSGQTPGSGAVQASSTAGQSRQSTTN